MKRRSWFSLLMVLVFTITLIAGSTGTKVYASYGDERKPESIVLDFSFFELNPQSDPQKYSEGANKFIQDSAELIQVLKDAYFVDMNQYVACAAALKFLEICKYLNQDKYANPLLDYLQNDDNASNVYSDFEEIINFEENYQKVFENTITDEIKDITEEASGMNKTQLIEAMDLYNKIIKICDAVLMNLPDYDAAKTKKAEAQKALDKLMGTIDSTFYSSDVHKKNVGGILYSGSAIKAGKETASQFKKTFTAKDNIYAIAYLPMRIKTLVPSLSFDGTYIGYETVSGEASFSVDGVESTLGDIVVPVNIQDYQANKGYVTFELLPSAANSVGYNLTGWYNNLFSKLTAGKHKISVTYTLNNTKVAQGEFELDWTNADLAKIKKNIEQSNTNASNYRANLRKMPAQFTVKHKQYKDASVSDAKIKALFMKKFPNATKILKFVNIGDNTDTWSVEKNDIGIPVAKWGTMETWVVYKAKDGWCYITQIKMKSTYTGGGTYGAPYILVEMDSAKIAEKNVK